jgi:hypothetical protein
MTDRQATEALARLKAALPGAEWQAMHLDVDHFFVFGRVACGAAVHLCFHEGAWSATAAHLAAVRTAGPCKHPETAASGALSHVALALRNDAAAIDAAATMEDA